MSLLRRSDMWIALKSFASRQYTTPSVNRVGCQLVDLLAIAWSLAILELLRLLRGFVIRRSEWPTKEVCCLAIRLPMNPLPHPHTSLYTL